MLPDRYAQQPPAADQGGMLHPDIQALVAAQRAQQQMSPADMALRFGLGVLSGGPRTWMQSGAEAVLQGVNQRPDSLGMLQALQASSELYALEEARREKQQRKQSVRQLADQLRQQGREAEAVALENDMLTKDAVGDLLGIDTGSDETYGTAQNLVEIGADDDGNPRYGVLRLGNRGTYEIQELPPGVQPRMTPGYEEELARAKQRGSTIGTDEGEAVTSFPMVQYNAAQMVAQVDDLINDEAGLRRTFGIMSKLPKIPGGTAADYAANLARLQGMAFLQAYQTLRGGGQITEVEGQKAEAAIVALAESQSPQQAKQNLQKLKTAIQELYEIQRKKAAPDAPSIFEQTPAAEAAPAADTRRDWTGFRVVP
jgi:hypothetical protein